MRYSTESKEYKEKKSIYLLEQQSDKDFKHFGRWA